MPKEKSQKYSRRKRSWPRRIVRFVLWSLLVVFVLILVLLLGLVLYFTPHRIESIAEKTVSQQLQQDFSFTNAHFNIFNGFVFEDIVLSPPPDSVDHEQTLPVHSATAHRIALRYSVSQILQRKLLITSALIDSPQVYIKLTPAHLDTTAEKSGAASEQKAATDSAAAPQSFVAVNLQKFRLRNAGITVDMLDSLQQQHIYLSDISISLDDINVPRGNLFAQDSLLAGHFQLKCDNSQLAFSQQTPEQSLDFHCLLDMDVHLSLAGLSHITLDGLAKIDSLNLAVDKDMLRLSPDNFYFPFVAEIRGDINAAAGAARFDPIDLKVDEEQWLSLDIRADSLLSTPFVSATVAHSRIPIHQLISMARPFVADSLMPSIYLHNANSYLSLAGASVEGFLPDSSNGEFLNCRGVARLENFGVTLNRNEQFLRNLNFFAEASVLLGYDALSNAKINASLSYDSVFVTLPDSQKAFTGPATLTASAGLNPNFYPAVATADMSISNVLGAEISAGVSLKSGGDLASLNGSSYFSVQEIDIAPFTQSQLQSTVSTYAELRLHSFQDIEADVNVVTDSITVQQEFDNLALAPIELVSEFRGATDTLFQNFAVRSLTASLNDFVTTELTGRGGLTPHPHVDVNQLLVSLDHAKLLQWLPVQLRQSMGDLSVSGQTTLNSEVHLSTTDVDTIYDAKLHVQTADFNVNVQNGLLSLNDVLLNLNGQIDSRETAHISIALNIPDIQSSEFSAREIRDNRMLLQLSMPNFETVQIDTGFLDLPALKTNGIIGGEVKLVNNTPLITSSIRLRQNAADTIRLLPDVFYRGKNEITIDVQSDSAIATVSARVQTTDLTVSLPNNVRVDQINADVIVKQNIDLVNGIIIIAPDPIINTPSDGMIDYRLYRDYYFQREKKPSTLHIRRAVVGDYLVEHIRADAYIGAGTVEIPIFALDAYGGNIGGSFSFIGDKENLLESSYKLSAHMSGINSSLLLPSLQSKSQGLLTAHSELSGKGFDIAEGIDLEGYFHITKIESKVASNLLTALDPEGKDSAIKFTKLVMNYGYKPSLFTFDIGNGYCYPAVTFSQPWYNPIRLSGGSIEFARIPIASLLNFE